MADFCGVDDVVVLRVGVGSPMSLVNSGGLRHLLVGITSPSTGIEVLLSLASQWTPAIATNSVTIAGNGRFSLA